MLEAAEPRPGFHGCDQATLERVVLGDEHLQPSTDDHDWLGSGVYFWEQNYERANQWARESGSVKDPSVMGAVIDLGNCLNLTDSHHFGLVAHEYELLRRDFEETDRRLPGNTLTDDLLLRRLDRAVIEHLHERIASETSEGIALHDEFDSARGLFPEGEQVYPNAGFRAKTHIQICVRNPNCIKGYFVPL